MNVLFIWFSAAKYCVGSLWRRHCHNKLRYPYALFFSVFVGWWPMLQWRHVRGGQAIVQQCLQLCPSGLHPCSPRGVPERRGQRQEGQQHTNMEGGKLALFICCCWKNFLLRGALKNWAQSLKNKMASYIWKEHDLWFNTVKTPSWDHLWYKSSESRNTK